MDIQQVDISDYQPYLKYDEAGYQCMAQQTYEPLVSSDGKVFCKNYAFPNEYQYQETNDRPHYTQEVVDWFWNTELFFLNYFQNKPYAPEVLHVDEHERRIFLKWYSYSCNDLIYKSNNWPKDNWMKQIQSIITDQYKEGVYKLTMYPHCHYTDNDGQMRCIDWYGCVPTNYPFIQEKFMRGIIHGTAEFRLNETGPAQSGLLNLETMFKRSLSTHVKWGEYNLDFIHRQLFNG
jgi:hypothetical protein